MPEAASSARVRGLSWVLAALAGAAMPHVLHVPAWVTLLLLAVGAWRWTADLRGWPLPPRACGSRACWSPPWRSFGTYRTLNGIEAGTAFLVLMAAAKLLETRTARDLTVLVFIAWFLLYAALLRDQGLLQLPWLAGSAILTAGGPDARARGGGARPRRGRSCAARMGCCCRPCRSHWLLFLLFPRLPGPFWGIDSRAEARTGLDDEMTPGDVSDLSASGEVAFRARFDGEPPPPDAALLARTGAARIRRPQLAAAARAGVPADAGAASAGGRSATRSRSQPHARRWVLALDLPSRVARARGLAVFRPHAARLAQHQQRRCLRPRLASGVHGRARPCRCRCGASDLELPGDGSNPRSVALGRELAARHPDDPGARSANCSDASAANRSSTRCSRRASPTMPSTSSCSRPARASASTTRRRSRS